MDDLFDLWLAGKARTRYYDRILLTCEDSGMLRLDVFLTDDPTWPYHILWRDWFDPRFPPDDLVEQCRVKALGYLLQRYEAVGRVAIKSGFDFLLQVPFPAEEPWPELF